MITQIKNDSENRSTSPHQFWRAFLLVSRCDDG